MSEKRFEEYSIMEIIEAGLRTNGIPQEYIDEAKRQILEEINLSRLTAEERFELGRKTYKRAVNSDSAPMPTQDEINAMYEKEADRRANLKTEISGIDFAKLVKLVQEQPVKAVFMAKEVKPEPKKGFLSRLAFWK